MTRTIALVLVLVVAGCAGPVSVPPDAPPTDAPWTWERVGRPTCDGPAISCAEWTSVGCGDAETLYPESVSLPRCVYDAVSGSLAVCRGPGEPGCYRRVW